MAVIGFIGLKWTDSRGRVQSTKFNWHTEAKRILGPAVAVALQKAGMEVRRTTQRQMVGGGSKTGRRLRSIPQLWKVGERDGFAMVAMVRRVPRRDRVSSWSPMAFLRNDVESKYDARTESAVIGPSKFPWLNRLHEFGGPLPVYFRPIRSYPIGGQIGPNVRLPKKWDRSIQGRDSRGRFKRMKRGAYVGYLQNEPGAGSINLGVRTVRGRAYMELGLQASMKKIPPQFRNTIGYGSIKKWQG